MKFTCTGAKVGDTGWASRTGAGSCGGINIIGSTCLCASSSARVLCANKVSFVVIDARYRVSQY